MKNHKCQINTTIAFTRMKNSKKRFSQIFEVFSIEGLKKFYY